MSHTMAHTSSTPRARVVFFGTSNFAVPILERLVASPYRPFLVVSTPGKPAGRGMELREPPVKLVADQLGIPVIQPESLKTCPPGRRVENCLPAGKAGKLKIPAADLFIVAAYGKILPKELLAIPAHGALNIHPSIIPRWRGPSPVQFTILNGDAETGVTIMLMDEKVDHGPILRNSKFKIPNSKITAVELSDVLAKLGADLLLETIPEWLVGHISPEEQDHAQATFSRILMKEDGRIDWSHPAVEIERMIRAFSPWPSAYTLLLRRGREVRLHIEAASVVTRESVVGTSPGTVSERGGLLSVATSEGEISLEHVRPEGKQSMNGAAFRNGYRDIIGSVFH